MPFAAHRLGKFSFLPYLLLLIVVAGVLGSGYWFWQAYEFSRAFRALKAERYEEAMSRTERLMAFGPDKRRAEVIHVRALIELDLENAREELDELLAGGGVREHPEVGLAYLRLRLETNDLAGVDQYLDDWAASLADQPDYYLMRAKIRASQKRWPDVMASLDQLLAIDPQNAEALLLRAQLLLAEGNRAAAIQAKANLRQAADDKAETGLAALHLLATHPLIPLFDNDREWLAYTLNKHRQANVVSRLLAATQQLQLTPKKRDDIIAEAVRKEAAKDPRKVAEWLMSVGAYPQLIQFLKSPMAVGIADDPRFGKALDAFVLNSEISKASELLSSAGGDFNEVRRATLRAHVAAVDDKGPPTEWREAFQLAQDASATMELLSLANLAYANGWMELAQEAMDAAIGSTSDIETQVWLYNLYLLAAASQGKTAEALELARRSLAVKPDDHAMQNNYYYLAALLDAEPEADPHRMGPMLSDHPASIYLSTYAFTLWKAGLTEEARNQFAQMDRRYLSVPSCRLVGGLLALSAGDYEQAHVYLDGLNVNQLMPEEAKLYAQAKKTLSEQAPQL